MILVSEPIHKDPRHGIPNQQDPFYLSIPNKDNPPKQRVAVLAFGSLTYE